ncbi:Tachylectin [Pristimantis euphronides]
MALNKNVDWFSVARRVGKYEWSRIKLIFFHPNGDLYATTYEGEFYKGPQPDNENITWMYQKAKKIGARFWSKFEAMFFDNEGNLHAVSYDKFYKGTPPSEENSPWLSQTTLIGDGGWSRLTHFMGFTPDNKLWCIDKYNGNIYRGDPPTKEDTNYLKKAEYLGWKYHEFRFLSFTKDKTIRKILNFDFLIDEGEIINEMPEVLEEKIYDNRRSSSTLNHTFTLHKSIKEYSSFTHSHGFQFEVGVETTIKTGIPSIAEGSTTIKMKTTTTHDWSFTETNETEVTFESSTQVELPAGKAIRMVASVMKAEMNVPYKWIARTMFDSEVEIRGMWKGVSHYNLMVKQEDYDK